MLFLLFTFFFYKYSSFDFFLSVRTFAWKLILPNWLHMDGWMDGWRMSSLMNATQVVVKRASLCFPNLISFFRLSERSIKIGANGFCLPLSYCLLIDVTSVGQGVLDYPVPIPPPNYKNYAKSRTQNIYKFMYSNTFLFFLITRTV